MRSDSELYLPKLFGSKNANVRSTLTGPFMIDEDGPSIYFLNPAGATRAVRLPWVAEGQTYTIVNVGLSGTLSVVDGDGTPIFNLDAGVSGIFISSNYKWYQVVGGGGGGGGGSGRITVSGTVNYYVSTTGDDATGDGTSGNEWATVQHAVTWIATNIQVDPASISTTIYINVADGTYTTTSGLVLPPMPLCYSATLFIIGNATTPSNVVFNTSNSAAVVWVDGVNWYLMGIKFDASTDAHAAVDLINVGGSTGPAMAYTLSCVYGKAGNAGTGNHNVCWPVASTASISTQDSTITGIANTFQFIKGESTAPAYGYIQHGSLNLTINPGWPNGCFYIARFGEVYCNIDGTVTGTSSGPQFKIDGSARLGCGAPFTLIPGNSALNVITGVIQDVGNGEVRGGPKALTAADNSGTVLLKAPNSLASYTLTLPPNDGNSGEVLQTNGSGVTTWVAGGGGGGGAGRQLLTGDLQLYVATTGNDSNDGLTAGTPWLTIQHGLDYVANKIDGGGHTVFLNIAAGTYSSPALSLIGPIPGLSFRFWTAGAVTIDVNDYANVYVWDAAVQFGGGGTFNFINSGVGAMGIWIDQGATVGQDANTTLTFKGNPGFNQANFIHIYGAPGGAGTFQGPIVCDGLFGAHMNADAGMLTRGYGAEATTTFVNGAGTGAGSSGALYWVTTNGEILIYGGHSWIGTYTGRSYIIEPGGNLNLFGQTSPGTAGLNLIADKSAKFTGPFNGFDGQIAIGPYNAQNSIVFAPGDPVNAGTFAQAYSQATSSLFSGDLSVIPTSDWANWSGHKHTGTGAAIIVGMDLEPLVNSDSTGPVQSLSGAYIGPINYGPGNVTFLRGVEVAAIHAGSGTVATAVAGTFGVALQAGVVTDSIAGVFYNSKETGAATNTYGVYVYDHSGTGTSKSYNLVSLNAGYAGTMSSTAGGNLFQGHIAIGNYADVDGAVFAPGDPTNQFRYTNYLAPLTVSEYKTGDLSAGAGSVGIVNYSGYKHTGTGSAYVYGMDSEPIINSDSTGPFGFIYGSYINPFNYGSGNIDGLTGIFIRTSHNGSGLVTDAWGIDVGVNLSHATGDITNAYSVDAFMTVFGGGTITNSYELLARTPSVSSGSTITNAYGVYVEDHDSKGTARAYNILSLDAGYLGTMGSRVGGNLFQGHVAVGNFADVNAFSAFYGDERRSGDLSTSSVVYSFNSALTNTGTSGGFPAGLQSNAKLVAGSTNVDAFSAGSFAMTNESTNNAPVQGIGASAHNNAVTIAGKCFLTALQANSYQYAATGTIDQTCGLAADVGAVMGGNVIEAAAVIAAISGYGGTITSGIGVKVDMQFANSGATITALTGVHISDTSGKAATALNLASRGAASRNLFEGIIKLGTGTNATPQDGDMWFDGSALKVRIAGVTKTVTVA
jgi:hypothetical protein